MQMSIGIFYLKKRDLKKKRKQIKTLEDLLILKLIEEHNRNYKQYLV